MSFICQRPWLRGLLNAPQDSLRKSAFAPMEPQAQATVCPYAYCTQKTVFPNAYMPPCPTRPSMPSGPGQKGSWRRKGDSFTLIILSCFIHCGYHRYFITYILGYPKKKQKSEFFFATHPTALCAVRKVYFSAQPNNLKLILKFEKYFPVEHIFVPACSSARKIHFFKF